jgi:oxygen-independent coproporphyrinogen-3 oxidase
MDPCSIYIHIPFCTSRCGYCDFNTFAGLESLIPDYTAALCKEIRYSAQSSHIRLPVHTIFFGGGTPSLVPIQQLDQILKAIKDTYILDTEAEITLEANPGTVSRDYLESLRALGFNRMSLGVQSAHPGELKLLDRLHDYPTVIRSVKWARQAGFDNLNLDLIFGLPEQRLETWQHTLKLTTGLHPEHFSLYTLSIEQDTPFGDWTRRGLILFPNPDLAADMYEWAYDFLDKNGYAQYEISNWALDTGAALTRPTTSPALACRQNLQYWHNLPYLGFGAGAHGYCSGYRTANVLNPSDYIRRLSESSATQPVFPATKATQILQLVNHEMEIGETMMTGLRLVREGVSEQQFQQRFGLALEQVYTAQITRLITNGLLEWTYNNGDRHLRLTRRGRLLGNQVFAEFI